MASFLLLPSPCSLLLKCGNSRTEIFNSGRIFTKHFKSSRFSVVSAKTSASTDADSGNGAVESPKARRGRKKKVTPVSAEATEEVEVEADYPPKVKKVKKKKIQDENSSTEAPSIPKTPKSAKSPKSVKTPKSVKPPQPVDEEGLWDYDDGMDLPYLDPPLVCCFGAAKNEFVPTVRVHDEQMHPDKYSEWKFLQWDPPEFGRAPGGPPCNVAVAHVRLGGRAEFMGKVGADEMGMELLTMMNREKVQTRALKFDKNSKTACTYMKVKLEDGKIKAEPVKEAAEDSFCISELNLAVLKEARIFHFNSDVLTIPSMRSSLFQAIAWSKKFGGLTFFDLNMPLPLWKSRDETRAIIDQAWRKADIIQVSREEMEFLLDEEYFIWKRNYKHQYYAENSEQIKDRKNYYHFTREDLAPLWHEGIKYLFVTDGTLRIHYYTPTFDGVVIGTEDAVLTPYTTDRSGSGDAIVAAIMRKLLTHPEMIENQDLLERQLRFVIAAGIIAQWTIGSVRGFPTESAAQNLKEQVYTPALW